MISNKMEPVEAHLHQIDIPIREERKLKSRFWFLAVSKTSLPPTVQQATTQFHLDCDSQETCARGIEVL